MTSLAQRCRETGANYRTALKRRARGWPECDLLAAPTPATSSAGKARPTKPTHPWRRSPGCKSRIAELSALNLRKKAKRDKR